MCGVVALSSSGIRSARWTSMPAPCQRRVSGGGRRRRGIGSSAGLLPPRRARSRRSISSLQETCRRRTPTHRYGGNQPRAGCVHSSRPGDDPAHEGPLLVSSPEPRKVLGLGGHRRKTAAARRLRRRTAWRGPGVPAVGAFVGTPESDRWGGGLSGHRPQRPAQPHMHSGSRSRPAAVMITTLSRIRVMRTSS